MTTLRFNEQDQTIPDKTCLNFWDEIYDDVERLIVAFFSLDDLISLFVVSKKYNKAVSKWAFNFDDYKRNFDSVAILPGMKHVIMLQNFAMSTAKKAEEAEETEDDKISTKSVDLAIVKLLVSKNITISKWFLDYLINDTTFLIYNLLSINNQLKRKEFSNLIIIALKSLKPFEKEAIVEKNLAFNNNNNEKKKKSDDDDNCNLNPKGNKMSLEFIDVLIGLIDEIVGLYWDRMESFWNIFEKIITFGNEYRHYFMNKQFISTMGEFYLGKQSPYAKDKPNKKYIVMGNKEENIDPNFTPLIHLISILVCSSHSPFSLKKYKQGVERLKKNCDNSNTINGNDASATEETQERTKTIAMEELFIVPPGSLTHVESINNHNFSTLFELSQNDGKLLRQRLFYNRMTRECWLREDDRQTTINETLCDYMNNICHHWCFSDELFSSEVIKLVIEGIDHSDIGRVDIYLSMLKKLISMKKDNLFQHRFNVLFNCDADVVGEERINLDKMDQRMHGNRDSKYGCTLDIIDLIEYYRHDHIRFCIKIIRFIFQCMEIDDQFGKLMLEIRNNRWKQWDEYVYNFCNINNKKLPVYLHAATKEVRKEREAFWNKYLDYLKLNNAIDTNSHLYS